MVRGRRTARYSRVSRSKSCWNGGVLETLRSDQKLADWLRVLEAADVAPIDVTLPEADELPEVLLDLAVPHEEINALVAHRDAVIQNTETYWLLERTVRLLAARIGTVGDRPRLPPLPQSWGDLGRYFYVYAFIATVPLTRAEHERRGISAEVSRRTLADLGRHIAVHRRRHGVGGLLVPDWLSLHLSGELYQLGRLQFQRGKLGERTGRAAAAAGAPVGPGSSYLELHIADFSGPLSPRACDRSLDLAREFFPKHYPEERHTVASCASWLLDPQLARYLPEDSNIVRFQRRFHSANAPQENYDRDALGFIFGDPDLPLETLPRDSTLQRAVVDHLRSGAHWYGGRGWFEL
jgi:hypothetical protein